MKSLKISNIVLFSLICCFEVALVYYFVSTVTLFNGEVAATVFVFLTMLPLYVLFTGILLVLTIILTITTKLKVKKQLAEGLQKTKFDKVCLLLPWLFILIDVVAFVVLLISSKNKAE